MQNLEQKPNSQPEQAVTPSTPSILSVSDKADIGDVLMEEFGYIVIHRKIIDWEWYQEQNTKSVFFHCLLKANWREKTWQGNIIKRGSFVCSVSKLSIELGISIGKVRLALERLIKTNELIVKTTNKYSYITVCKYEEYQDVKSILQQTNYKQTTNGLQTNNKQTATTKEYKESKKDNNIVFDFSDFENLKESLEKWLAYKSARNQRYKNQESFNLLAKSLNELSGGDPATALKIVERSMANNWAGIFKLNDNDNKGTNQPKPSGNFRTHIGEQDLSEWGKM